MIYPSHLSLWQRKVLSTRLMFLEAAQPAKLDFVRIGPDAIAKFDMLRHELFTLADEPFKNRRMHKTGPLDAFLQQVLTQFDQYVELRKAPHEDLVEPLAQNFRQKITSIACNYCTPLSQVCNGINPERDAEIVAKGGHCIAPLLDHFRTALEVTKKYYQEFSPLFQRLPETHLPDILFSTKFSLEKPHSFPVPFGVGGSTVYEEDPSQPASHVHLHLQVEEFDWETYMAVPYVLFHECLSHAFYGVGPIDYPREEPEPDDMFTEGWMDWVAFRILEEVIERKGPAGEWTYALLFSDEQHSIGRRFHDSRYEHHSTKRYNDSSAYSPDLLEYGRKAAKRLAYLLAQSFPGLNEDPWTAFLNISLDLNLYMKDQDIRKKFIECVYASMPEPPWRHGELDPSALRRLRIAIQALKEYFTGNKNIQKLINALPQWCDKIQVERELQRIKSRRSV